MALGDAATLVRKRGAALSAQNLKRWAYQLVCAVAHLHSRGILHQDIKAANVLVFGSATSSGATTVRLGDYSLSTLIMDARQGTCDLGTAMAYTATHRAPEVWRKERFSYGADVWALGCTLYELAYQQLLFTDQKGMPDAKVAYLKAIDAWSMYRGRLGVRSPERTPHAPKSKSVLASSPGRARSSVGEGLASAPGSAVLPLPSEGLAPPPRRLSTGTLLLPPIDHKPPLVAWQWDRPEMRAFNELLLTMITANTDRRASIWDVIKNPYFDDVRTTASLPTQMCYPLVAYPYLDVPQSVVEAANAMCSDPPVLEKALALYTRSGMGSTVTLRTCVNMAHKIIYKVPPIGTPKVAWSGVEDEIRLCLSLNHQLLAH